MVVPSNDFFQGNATPLQIFNANGSFKGPMTIQIYGSNIWDSDTEAPEHHDGPHLHSGPDPRDRDADHQWYDHHASLPNSAAFLHSIDGLTTAAGYTITNIPTSGQLLATIQINRPYPSRRRSLLSAWESSAWSSSVVRGHPEGPGRLAERTSGSPASGRFPTPIPPSRACSSARNSSLMVSNSPVMDRYARISYDGHPGVSGADDGMTGMTRTRRGTDERRRWWDRLDEAGWLGRRAPDLSQPHGGDGLPPIPVQRPDRARRVRSLVALMTVYAAFFIWLAVVVRQRVGRDPSLFIRNPAMVMVVYLMFYFPALILWLGSAALWKTARPGVEKSSRRARRSRCTSDRLWGSCSAYSSRR